jgi:hypothetical protein
MPKLEHICGPTTFDGALEDVFDLQDHVTSSVVGAIAPKLQREEIKRAKRKPTEIWMHTTIICVGWPALVGGPGTRTPKHSGSFARQVELDHGMACAYGMAAWCYVRRKARGWMDERIQESAEAVRLARKAVLLGEDDPIALCMGGYALALVAREFDDAAVFMDRGLAVNPNWGEVGSLVRG